MILNGVWLGLIFVLKLVLSLLGFAFGLNPFADGRDDEPRFPPPSAASTLASPTPGSRRLIVCAGIWLAYKGLVRREVAAGVGGHAGGGGDAGPRPLGRPSAPGLGRAARGPLRPGRAGRDRRPAGRLRRSPQRQLRRSDVAHSGRGWSRSPSPASTSPTSAGRSLVRPLRRWRGPTRSSATTSARSPCSRRSPPSATTRPSGPARSSPSAATARPARVIDLYLRSSPGSPARQALWDYFDNERHLQAQGRGPGRRRRAHPPLDAGPLRDRPARRRSCCSPGSRSGSSPRPRSPSSSSWRRPSRSSSRCSATPGAAPSRPGA